MYIMSYSWWCQNLTPISSCTDTYLYLSFFIKCAWNAIEMQAENGEVMEMSLSRKSENIVDNFPSGVWLSRLKKETVSWVVRLWVSWKDPVLGETLRTFTVFADGQGGTVWALDGTIPLCLSGTPGWRPCWPSRQFMCVATQLVSDEAVPPARAQGFVLILSLRPASVSSSLKEREQVPCLVPGIG